MAQDFWVMACDCGGHTLEIDDAVLVNWRKESAECSIFASAVPEMQDAILQWRARWTPQPTYGQLQAIIDTKRRA